MLFTIHYIQYTCVRVGKRDFSQKIKKVKKFLKIEKKRLTLYLCNGIIFKLSISESVILMAPNSVEKGN